MNKSVAMILCILLIASCNAFTLSAITPLFKTALLGVDDIEIDQDFIDSMKYSFLKVNVGRTGVAIFVLSNIEDDRYVWIGEAQEKIVTMNGKIVELSGLDKGNFKVFSSNSLNPILNIGNAHEYIIELDKPRAYLNVYSKFSYSEDGVISEDVIYDSVGWRFQNKYQMINGNVYYSEQKVSKDLPKLKISYYFK